MKLATPGLGGGAYSTAVPGPGIVSVTPDLIGASEITVNAGVVVTNLIAGLSDPYGPMNPLLGTSGGVEVSSGAGISVGPMGAITMTGENITINGSVSAPSGTIKATAAGTFTLGQGATVRAEGYNKPGTVLQLKGVAPNPIPKPGGTVTFSAGYLVLSPGSLVSVNGSSPVRANCHQCRRDHLANCKGRSAGQHFPLRFGKPKSGSGP